MELRERPAFRGPRVKRWRSGTGGRDDNLPKVRAFGSLLLGGVSSGMAVWRRGSDPDAALRLADEELYRAKAARSASPTG